MIVGSRASVRDFEDTLDLVRVGITAFFQILPRPNTLSLKQMPDDVPEEEKTRRIVALQDLQRTSDGDPPGGGRRTVRGRTR
jgi:tRNA A37 methylthiotransferase MiaB